MEPCDWKRLMAQYDDDMAFLSKNGAIVRGCEAIGQIFEKALQPPAQGGPMRYEADCGKDDGRRDTVDVIWRADPRNPKAQPAPSQPSNAPASQRLCGE